MGNKKFKDRFENLYETAFAEIFNGTYIDFDVVDRTYIYNDLTKKEIKSFYFAVTLKAIELYMQNRLKKELLKVVKYDNTKKSR